MATLNIQEQLATLLFKPSMEQMTLAEQMFPVLIRCSPI